MNIHLQFGFNHIVVYEKKAFEHFPIGSNVNLCIAVAAILDFRSTYADRKSKMAATTGHSINTGPYGENTEIYSSLKLLH
jgi:hypothetical protein